MSCEAESVSRVRQLPLPILADCAERGYRYEPPSMFLSHRRGVTGNQEIYQRFAVSAMRFYRRKDRIDLILFANDLKLKTYLHIS